MSYIFLLPAVLTMKESTVFQDISSVETDSFLYDTMYTKQPSTPNREEVWAWEIPDFQFKSTEC